MFTVDFDLTETQKQEARQIAIQAVGVKFTGAREMQEWFEREAGGNQVLAMFAAFMFTHARKQAEAILLAAVLNGDLMEVFGEA
jgi:hypothetical protein